MQIVFYLSSSLEQKMFHFKEKHSKRKIKKRALELYASRYGLELLSEDAQREAREDEEDVSLHMDPTLSA